MSGSLHLLLDIRREGDAVFLTLDDGEILELAKSSVPEELPEIGGSISSPLLAVIRLAAERKKVARRIFSMLDRRLSPVARIRRKLAEDGYSETAVDEVLDQMKRQGVYSDHVYAAAYCRDCLVTKAVGRRYLEAKLWGKQVPRDIAREVVAENLDEETEVELAHRAARWKWQRSAGRCDRKAEEKVARYLVGRGFPHGLVWKAVRKNKPHSEDPEGQGDNH
jgi:SOS response regulatory protein OraA/RecX